MIVIDTNILTYFLLPTPFSSSADQLYQLDPQWAVPLLWQSEFNSVLALYLRKKIINLPQAIELQTQAHLILEPNTFSIHAQRVLELVNQSTCSAYDCEFVALAQQLNTHLITQDKKLLKEFPKLTVSIKDFIQ